MGKLRARTFLEVVDEADAERAAAELREALQRRRPQDPTLTRMEVTVHGRDVQVQLTFVGANFEHADQLAMTLLDEAIASVNADGREVEQFQTELVGA